MCAESVLCPTCLVWLYSIALFRIEDVCMNMSAVFIFNVLLVFALVLDLATRFPENSRHVHANILNTK